MILRFTVIDPAAGARHDVELTAEPDTSVASLLAVLPIQVRERPCFVGSLPLDPETTVGASPLIGGCCLTVGERGQDTHWPPPGSAVVIRAVEGPDAGRQWALPLGAHLVGRSTNAAVPLIDLQASRTHAMFHISPDQVEIADAVSANGTYVDGVRVVERVPVPDGAMVRIGEDVLECVPAPQRGLHATRSPDGRLDFDRAFAPAPAIPRPRIELPTPESDRGNLKAVLASSAAPIALGVVMAAVLRQPAMLLLAAFAPLSALVSYVIERRQRKARAAAYEKAKAEAVTRIGEAVATEEQVRRTLAPDEPTVTLMATGETRGLWPRNLDSPDGLVVRVGVADLPATIELSGTRWEGFETPRLRSVPMTVDLRTTGVFGVAGPAPRADLLTNWLIIQLATLRSPDDLRLVVVTADDGDSLAWTRWLPHLDGGEGSPMAAWVGNGGQSRTSRITELKELVVARLEERKTDSGARFAQDVVVILHGALAMRNQPGMREVLRDGPSVGVYTICVDGRDMNECRGLCEVGKSGSWLRRDRSEQATDVRPDGMDQVEAERLARTLAPMRDRLTLAAAEAAIPYPVRFLDLLEVGTPAEDDVLSRWESLPGPTTEVPLGADGTGPVTVDLAKQGPHTMLAGATGAGKSVLLQTLVTSLLLANRPDELNLVLVDFKGGSAFLPFANCPHVVSLIRSTGETPADVFDDAAAARVLASVRAEVRRRESLLARYGGEIDAYWKDRGRNPALPALPRLVMIFDEFARVLETSPDFLKELVNVAAKGRSLGMHLLLATQSLQGKLSAELKNNIDLRITLRQNERADSVEVLDVPDAVTIPGRLRGRGMILCTKDEVRTPRLFQSGYLGDPPPVDGAAPAQVRLVDWSTLGMPRPEPERATGNRATDQDLAIAAIEAASTRLGLVAPQRPLLPPLAAEVSLADLPVEIPPTAVPFGLADDPAGQEQPVAALDLAATERWLIAGGPQSGRTTAVRSMLTSLVTRFRPDEAHVYVIEQNPAGLAEYARLPHCGGVLSPAEPDRVRRLVTWLGQEVQRRKVARLTATSPGAVRDPWIVLIVDGWEYLENRSDPSFEETSVLRTLRGVVTAGPPVGVHVVAVGGHIMMRSQTPDLYSRQVLLPFPKEETRRASLPSGRTSPPILPGRAIEAGSGLHLQIAMPGRSVTDLAAQGLPHQGLAAQGLPHQFPPLPAVVGADALEVPEPPSSTWFAVGVGGSDVKPVGVDLFDADPHLVLVTGPSGSGRTTAAAAFAAGLRRAGVGVLAVAPPRSPLRRLLPDDPGVRLVTGTQVKDADLRDAVSFFGEGRYAVILDDCEQITVTPSEDGFVTAPTLLEEIASPAAIGRQALVLCGDAGPILSSQRRSLLRVVQEVLTEGTRILLSPTHGFSARELGFQLEADQFFAGPPGRGYLGSGRTSELVQLAPADAGRVKSPMREAIAHPV